MSGPRSRRSKPSESGTLSRPELSELGAALPEFGGEAALRLLDGLAAGVVIVASDGRTLYVNAPGRALLTIQGVDPIGVSLRQFEPYTVWPDGRPCTYDDYPPIQCLRTGKPQRDVTIGLRMQSDRTIWVAVTAIPQVDASTGNVESALVTVVQSNHPQHIEESLRYSEERYRRLIENSPDAIVVHAGGPIVFINEAGVKLWRGKSRMEFIGRNILDFVDEPYREQAAERIHQIMEAGVYTPLIEQRHRRLDGKPVYVEVTGSPCMYEGRKCVQAMFRDITSRKRMDRRLKRNRQIMRVFFRRVPVLVAIYGRDGMPKALNREWRRVLGYGMDLEINDLLTRLYPDETMRAAANTYMRAAEPGWSNFWCRAADGRERLLSWANIAFDSGDHIGIALDVTEQYRAEENLRKAKAELEERVRERTEQLSQSNVELRRKQRFMEQALAVQERDRKLVAYEIHDTILQDVIAALMFVDSARERHDADGGLAGRQFDEARRLLRKSIDEARHMISGLRPPIIDEQGVAGAIDYLVSEFNARGMSIRYTHDIGCERLDPELETAIFRIVQEALQNVERHSGVKQAEVELTQQQDRIQIEVRDRGAGFDPDLVPERHFGLDGIRERARLLDGQATIESRPGAGTRVGVVLPVRLLENDA